MNLVQLQKADFKAKMLKVYAEMSNLKAVYSQLGRFEESSRRKEQVISID